MSYSNLVKSKNQYKWLGYIPENGPGIAGDPFCGFENTNPKVDIDLEGKKKVNKVRVFHMGDYAEGIKHPAEFKVSIDSKLVKELQTPGEFSVDGKWTEISFEDTVGAVVTIEVIRGGQWTLLGNIEVYGKPVESDGLHRKQSPK